MPMYELVLRFQGNEEVRITDSPITIGQTLLIDNREWVVEARILSQDMFVTARFICLRPGDRFASPS
jgi:hypothetical protein